jgi:hypothetical protein
MVPRGGREGGYLWLPRGFLNNLSTHDTVRSSLDAYARVNSPCCRSLRCSSCRWWCRCSVVLLQVLMVLRLLFLARAVSYSSLHDACVLAVALSVCLIRDDMVAVLLVWGCLFLRPVWRERQPCMCRCLRAVVGSFARPSAVDPVGCQPPGGLNAWGLERHERQCNDGLVPHACAATTITRVRIREKHGTHRNKIASGVRVFEDCRGRSFFTMSIAKEDLGSRGPKSLRDRKTHLSSRSVPQ